MWSMKIDRTNLMRFGIGVMSNFMEVLNLQIVSRFVQSEIRDVTFMPRIREGQFFRYHATTVFETVKNCVSCTVLLFYRYGQPTILAYQDDFHSTFEEFHLKHLPSEIKTDAPTFRVLLANPIFESDLKITPHDYEIKPNG